MDTEFLKDNHSEVAGSILTAGEEQYKVMVMESTSDPRG